MEGWDGLFIWPEDIPRAEPHRERWGDPGLGGFHLADGQRGVSKRPSGWAGLWGSGIKVKPGPTEGVGLEILVGNLVVSTHPPNLNEWITKDDGALDICISSLIFFGYFRYIC